MVESEPTQRLVKVFDDPDPEDRDLSAPETWTAHPIWQRTLRFGGSVLVIALFVGALFVLHRWLERYSVEDIRGALRRLPAWQIAAASGLAAFSYALLTLYDVLALHHLRRTLPYRWIAFTAFTSYAFSHSFGFASIVGAAVRYRLYSPLGMAAIDVAQVTLFVITTFTIGLVIVLPLVMAIDPTALVA